MPCGDCPRRVKIILVYFCMRVWRDASSAYFLWLTQLENGENTVKGTCEIFGQQPFSQRKAHLTEDSSLFSNE
jgi:hypothetical protein